MNNIRELTSSRSRHILANDAIFETLVFPDGHARNVQVERQHLYSILTASHFLHLAQSEMC